MASFLKFPIVKAKRSSGHDHEGGFSLIESLMAVLILTIGFMFVGPMMVNSIGSTTLARSKSTAGLAAAQILDSLALKYKANAANADLTVGTHGPTQVAVTNPIDSNIVNRYSVGWTVSTVVTSGKTLKAVQVTATATPIGSTGTSTNNKVGQNKIISITTIFSLRN
jgi:prepilin-type N-terminal cleavage/methylation domain-containing protein